MTSGNSNRFLPIAVVAVLLLLGGGGAFAWFGWAGAGQQSGPVPEEPPAVVTPEVEKPALPAPVASGTVEVQTPEQAGVPPEDCIAYPDGTKLPPLNGVKKAPRIAFHRRLPFTKVVGKFTDSRGLEWYVHENGAMSTTRYQLRNGQQEAVGEVSMPAAPAGVVDK